MRCAGVIRKYYCVITSLSAMVLLAALGAQTMPLRQPATAYQASVFNVTSQEVALPTFDIPVETSTTSTTSTTIVEIVTTTTTEPPVVRTTVTTRVPRTTTTEPYVPTTLTQIVTSGSDGPPRNTTTLVGCIAYYESTWGKDPNVFQFTQGTWETYGGTGSPSRASYATQEKIFWIAWEDDGHHHWAAQKGRCF
jgi:hypothetical protein